jgi:hypothetical protein
MRPILERIEESCDQMYGNWTLPEKLKITLQDLKTLLRDLMPTTTFCIYDNPPELVISPYLVLTPNKLRTTWGDLDIEIGDFTEVSGNNVTYPIPSE